MSVGKTDTFFVRHALRLVENDTAAVRPNLDSNSELEIS
jgi:hypothetical protein